mgnify:CR=1 FL=1
MININIIYFIIIAFYICSVIKRNFGKKEKFSQIDIEGETSKVNDEVIANATKEEIDKCINRHYIMDKISLDNLNIIIKNFNSNKKLIIPTSLNLSDTHLVINKESNIYSGQNRIDFFKSMVKDNNEVIFKSFNGAYTKFGNCPRKYQPKHNLWFGKGKHRGRNHIFKVMDIRNIKTPEKNPLNLYVNGKDGEYNKIYQGNFKFNKYTNHNYYKHNSKEAQQWRNLFIKKCNEKNSKYNNILCNKVKKFKPLPLLKKNGKIY